MYREISSSDINLGVLEVSKKTVALISLSIVEFLLFNRNQIPFVFEKFQYMVKRLEERKIKLDTDTEGNSVAYAIERHRNIAIGTHKQILEIQNIVCRTFEKYEFQQMFIVFGATKFTAKEAFIINLPPISSSESNNALMKQTIISSILMCPKFFTVNFKTLKSTNTFIFIKPKIGEVVNIFNDFQRVNYKLPAMCKTTVFNIQTERFIIYEDNFSNKQIIEKISDVIYECKIFIQGFKEKKVRGQNIWT